MIEVSHMIRYGEMRINVKPFLEILSKNSASKARHATMAPICVDIVELLPVYVYMDIISHSLIANGQLIHVICSTRSE